MDHGQVWVLSVTSILGVKKIKGVFKGKRNAMSEAFWIETSRVMPSTFIWENNKWSFEERNWEVTAFTVKLSNPRRDLDRLPKTGEPCSEPGCEKKTTASGFCVACYYRHLRNGSSIRGAPTNKKRHRLQHINSEGKTAFCAACDREVKIQFRGTSKNGLKQWRCAVDSNHRSKLYKRAYRQAKKEMLGKNCEICGSSENLCWDHCHASKMFRGTLCNNCNTMIGFAKEDPSIFNAAIKYLESEAPVLP